MSRNKRYHREIFFPEWSEKSVNDYIDSIYKSGPIKFSLHSVEKIAEYLFEYGNNLFKFFSKSLRKTSLKFENVFEFYSNNENVNKACFRFSFEELPVDFILVISSDGVVITVYLVNKGDNHNTLDKKLYEKGEK